MNASRHQQMQQADRRGRRILVACTTALIVMGTTLVYSRPSPRDPHTACAPDMMVKTHTVAVIDRTDAWNANDARLLHTALLAIARDINVNDRLSLIPFDGTAERPPTPLFDRCNPGDVTTANIAIRTPAHVEKVYQDAFAAPLTTSLATITKPSNAPQTHLVAFLSNVAAHLAYERRATNIRIIVFSDMAENTATVSVYPNKKGAAFSNAAFASYVADLVRDRFKGIALEIYAMPAPNSTPAFNRRIKEAWTHALKTNAITYSWRQL